MKVTVTYRTEFGASESIMNVKKVPAFSEKFTIISVKPYKPFKDKFKSFDGTNQTFTEDDETSLAEWGNIKYRINNEGIDYCFKGYSNWKEIKDKKFHKLRKKFLKSMEKLKNYIDNKANLG